MKRVSLRVRAWLLAVSLCSTPVLAATLQNAGWTITSTLKSAVAVHGSRKVVLYGNYESSCGDARKVVDEGGAALALVGHYASTFSALTDGCGAHPYLKRDYQTVDLNSGQPVSLRDLFSDQQLFTALLADPFVRGALKGHAAPSTLTELQDTFEQFSPNCTAIDDRAFARFAFYALRPEQVGVRMNMLEQATSCSPGFVQLGLWLPVPTALRAALQDANTHHRLGIFLAAKSGIDFLRH